MQTDAPIEDFLKSHGDATLLRFVTLGSVDDGKSTLIGRLLYDSGNIPVDQAKILEESQKSSLSVVPDFSLLTDGLLAEQEQKITIDVAYRYFRTEKRVFILADSPGHEQYTRNMATAASNAQLALLLVDARKGISTQTKRHAFIASLLGISRVVLVINKMDLVEYKNERYDELVREFLDFSPSLSFSEVRSVPVSSLYGANVVHPAPKEMPWYRGDTLLQLLEKAYVGGERNLIDFRYVVQNVIRPHQDFRGYAGQILSGRVQPGDRVEVLPSRRVTQVKGIHVLKGADLEQVETAFAPQSVTITLEDEVDVSRGDMLPRVNNVPHEEKRFEAMLVWFNPEPLEIGKDYLLLHCSRFLRSQISSIGYRVEVDTLSRESTEQLQMNEIGRVEVNTQQSVYFDPYEKNRATGSFVVIDPTSYMTVGAGMIIDRLPSDELRRRKLEDASAIVSKNLHQEKSSVERQLRLKGGLDSPLTLWFTGLSGSGKSTICRKLEAVLFEKGIPVFWLDGDKVRSGLCRDLGFSPSDRKENLRRVAEVAKLFNDAGMVVLCSFISPREADREMIASVIGDESYRLIHVSTPLEVCEERDLHGLYARARKGEIPEFTGVSAPYEEPSKPALNIETTDLSIDDAVDEVVQKFFE